MRRFTISAAGARLDAALAGLMPQLGRRGARRLIGDGRATVNGRLRPAHYRVQFGDAIQIEEEEPGAGAPRAALIGRQGPFVFFFKPAGMHVAALAGRSDASLEGELPRIAERAGLERAPLLLQRLDFGTSGLVCGALGAEAERLYRGFEMRGQCWKSYLALLRGRMEAPATAKRGLDGNGGMRVRIKPGEAPEAEWTHFAPLWQGEAFGVDATIAECRLGRGKRHQIRAHAASLGFPLLGDGQYGGGAGSFLLEHVRLRFPGHDFAYRDHGSELARILEGRGPGGEARCM